MDAPTSPPIGNPAGKAAPRRATAPRPPVIIVRQRAGLARQAVSAVVCFVGFYLLALLSVVLLVLPFFVIRGMGFFSPYLTLASIALAILILVAVTPRPDRFKPPGPRLDAAQHPRLFALLTEVAERTGQPLPAEVYLILDVNAFVGQRGGILGVGSRRVMGIGLGLLQVLTRAEFQTVLAHEFGHYYDAHLRFVPWIYQARQAMIRMVESLKAWDSTLYAIYWYYTLFFLRITQRLSRTQEFIADELSARLYGAQRAARTLSVVHTASDVFDAYWQREMIPFLRIGYRPPIFEGFVQRFRQNRPPVAGTRPDSEATDQHTVNAYDSHPSLADRLHAMESIRAEETENVLAAGDSAPAITLLNNPAALEGLLVDHIFGSSRAQAMRPISWNQVDGRMTLADYEDLVRQHAPVLKGRTPQSLLALSTYQVEYFGIWLMPTPQYVRGQDRDRVNDLAVLILSAALMLALRQAGWQIELRPKGYFLCHRGTETFDPAHVVHHLRLGLEDTRALQREFSEAGIAHMDLGTVAPPVAAPGSG